VSYDKGKEKGASETLFFIGQIKQMLTVRNWRPSKPLEVITYSEHKK